MADSDKAVLLPTLHIKLGVPKQFVKAEDTMSDAFQHICATFPSYREQI